MTIAGLFRFSDQLPAMLWRILFIAAGAGLLVPFIRLAVGDMPADDFIAYIQQLASGVAIGCIYALIALGIVLIYKATETINFAQGELLMLGAFFAYTTIGILGMPFWIGMLVAVLASGLFGIAAERAIIRPLVGEPAFALVMVTIGLSFLSRSLVSMTPGWGTDTYTIYSPFTDQTLSIGAVVISQDHAAIIVITFILSLALYLFFSRTRIGIAMQAVSENQLAAWYMGIPVKTIFTLIWGLSAITAGFAGLLLAPIAFIHSQMGFIVFKAFAAAVLGGLTSLPGAVAGGIIIGVSEILAGFYLPPGFKDVAAYIILLLVLVLKPDGIFGGHGRKKV